MKFKVNYVFMLALIVFFGAKKVQAMASQDQASQPKAAIHKKKHHHKHHHKKHHHKKNHHQHKNEQPAAQPSPMRTLPIMHTLPAPSNVLTQPRENVSYQPGSATQSPTLQIGWSNGSEGGFGGTYLSGFSATKDGIEFSANRYGDGNPMYYPHAVGLLYNPTTKAISMADGSKPSQMAQGFIEDANILQALEQHYADIEKDPYANGTIPAGSIATTEIQAKMNLTLQTPYTQLSQVYRAYKTADDSILISAAIPGSKMRVAPNFFEENPTILLTNIKKSSIQGIYGNIDSINFQYIPITPSASAQPVYNGSFSSAPGGSLRGMTINRQTQTQTLPTIDLDLVLSALVEAQFITKEETLPAPNYIFTNVTAYLPAGQAYTPNGNNPVIDHYTFDVTAFKKGNPATTASASGWTYNVASKKITDATGAAPTKWASCSNESETPDLSGIATAFAETECIADAPWHIAEKLRWSKPAVTAYPTTFVPDPALNRGTAATATLLPLGDNQATLNSDGSISLSLGSSTPAGSASVGVSAPGAPTYNTVYTNIKVTKDQSGLITTINYSKGADHGNQKPPADEAFLPPVAYSYNVIEGTVASESQVEVIDNQTAYIFDYFFVAPARRAAEAQRTTGK